MEVGRGEHFGNPFDAVTQSMLEFVAGADEGVVGESVVRSSPVRGEIKQEELSDEQTVCSAPIPVDCLMEDYGEAGAVENANDMISLDDLEEDLSVDVSEMAFDFVPSNLMTETDILKVASESEVLHPVVTENSVTQSGLLENSVVTENSVTQSGLLENSVVTESESLDERAVVNIRGMRAIPEPELFLAGKGTERQRSAHNDKWSLRRADELRAQLGWDMSVAFVDLPFKQMDDLLQNLFSRVTKVNGEQYPGASLVNMMNGFNRMIRRAYDIRVLNGRAGEVAEKDFNIKRHRSFTRTRLVLNAAIKKGGKDGVNKKVKKVPEITQPMEDAIFIDLEHQVTSNYGCQKRLAAYLMLRIGIRGGKELWLLKRKDIQVLSDVSGKEYVKFEERTSKANEYTIDRTQEHQFRKNFHSYEPDFLLTVKQYYRHLPPLEEASVIDDLFTTPNQNPAGLVWYNKKHKVSQEYSGQWLSNMLRLVGLPENLFSNKSGRVSLITRMAARGVPHEIGMMISGHHTQGGYARYDRTADLKQAAATLVSSRPDLDYATALKEVTDRYNEEQQECSVALKPLVAAAQIDQWEELKKKKGKVDENAGSCSTNKLEATTNVPSMQGLHGVRSEGIEVMHTENNQLVQRQPNQLVRLSDCQQHRLAIWHKDYDGIDWDMAILRDPALAKAMGGRKVSVNTVAGNTFSNMHNCTIQIICQPAKDDKKENDSIKSVDKENTRPSS